MSNPQPTDFAGFEAIASRFPNAKTTGKTARSWCPVHQADGHSSRQNRSLMMRELPNSSIQIKCNAGCEHRDIIAAVGLHYVDLLPNDMRHSRSPHVKPKFEGWPCLQVAEAIQADVHLVRIFGGMIIDNKHSIEGAMPFDQSEWDQLRAAHHRLSESLQKIERGVRYG